MARARQLGCAALGITRAGPVADHPRLLDWLARGCAADMDYLARHAALRADPRRLLDRARSVVVIAVPYATAVGERPGDLEKAAGRVAGIFAGRDYHRVVRTLLEELAETLGVPPTGWRAFVDTGPVLERSLAVAAGLGHLGRHTQLLVPGHGARVTLGVLLTERELEPDPPFAQDLCGDCDACLRACPTAALHADAGLDARRCLSYWTTGSRQPIPPALRGRLGNRLYGCDSCQVCCPHDPCDDTTAPPHPELGGDRARDLDTLHGLLAQNGKGLQRTLGDTALGWIGRTALLRTVCVVLGNHADPSSAGPLTAALRDRDPIIRGHAAWGLGQLRSPKAYAALEAAQGTEADPGVLQELQEALRLWSAPRCGTL